ncbi:NUDIX domain-containing protein [Denitratisoma oestradiolicum]|uniref:GDP-mannose pyrophosphatase n=1 Tax=Denitratisoma oestradiolicum TaxID=311182 RepID=A0A6S6Y6B7_9PROT|nr:NUDIX hydrolase [Denitratisoma oestradiolicum]TWO79422.1 NUDIX hydrolase [Denitratisoma oestradiolicum]CAB1368128.1 Zn-finger containing NTP pyrophosphohydrolase [Denitratisoma oestradiolicum]
MKDEDLMETELTSEEVFAGRLLRVHRDRVRLADGHETTREWIAHPGAVVIVAPLDNGKLLLERQFRYPLRRIFLELPAGKIDPAEHPLDTARRELREETGYKARNWHHLGTMHPCIGYSNERIEIFLAHGLSYVGHERDQGEHIEVIEMCLADALLAVRDGEITDAKTITALLWADKMFSGQWPLPG